MPPYFSKARQLIRDRGNAQVTYVRAHEGRLGALERLSSKSVSATNLATIVPQVITPTLATHATIDGISADVLTVLPNGDNVVYIYAEGDFIPVSMDDSMTYDMSGEADDTKYDVFLYASEGENTTAAIGLSAWTDYNNRAVALATTNGVTVLSTDYSWRYIGWVIYDAGGEHIINTEYGDVNWGGAVDGATAGHMAVFADASGKVILDGGAIPAGGDVTGPASAVDNDIATFDGITGKVVKDASGITALAGVLRSAGDLLAYGANGDTDNGYGAAVFGGNALAASDGNGGDAAQTGGVGDGAGEGGEAGVYGGEGGTTGLGGAATVAGGTGGNTSGDGGPANLFGGNSPTLGDGGTVTVGGGGATTDGNGGPVIIGGGSGASNGDGGNIEATPGQGAGAGVDGVILLGDGSANYVQITRGGAMSFAGNARLLHPVRVETDDTTQVAGDFQIICNKATAMSVTLLPATGSGQPLEIKNIGAGDVTVTADATGTPDTIDGQATQIVKQWDNLVLMDAISDIWIIR